MSVELLSEEEVKQKVDSYRNKLPSVVLDEIMENLKGKKVTGEQLEKILERAVARFEEVSGGRLDEVYDKVNALERLIARAFAKLPKLEGRTEESIEDVKAEEGKADFGRVGEAETVSLAEGADTKVKLLRVPETTMGTILLLKWLEFLLTKVGYGGLEEVLSYYVDIGWISEAVMFQMVRYARGIKIQLSEGDGLMTTQDHITSLLFIEALKNGCIGEDELFAVEREVQKIKRGANQIWGLALSSPSPSS